MSTMLTLHIPKPLYLHEMMHGQQVEGDSPPLLHSSETTPGIPYPALEPPKQERHLTVGADREKAQTESWSGSSWRKEGSNWKKPDLD